ncbi:hypothetical protein NC652_024411 [Populus alba x Populus x berolinensis]|nr:hypothetical protein NC652_024411 [Populus alba x Populus x berolinensis]
MRSLFNTKLYFGNLPYNVDSAQLAGIIQEYGSPEMVEDESQLSRLFNVNRGTRRCIIVACEKGEVNDCLTDDLTFAAREVLFPNFTATRGFGKKLMLKYYIMMEYTNYEHGCRFSITEKHGRSRVFAFVTMSSIEDCNAFIENLDESVKKSSFTSMIFSVSLCSIHGSHLGL